SCASTYIDRRPPSILVDIPGLGLAHQLLSAGVRVAAGLDDLPALRGFELGLEIGCPAVGVRGVAVGVRAVAVGVRAVSVGVHAVAVGVQAVAVGVPGVAVGVRNPLGTLGRQGGPPATLVLGAPAQEVRPAEVRTGGAAGAEHVPAAAALPAEHRLT